MTNATNLRGPDGEELVSRFARRQPTLYMQSGGDNMSWQQQTDLQNARTGANSIVHDSSQQQAAADAQRMTGRPIVGNTQLGAPQAGAGRGGFSIPFAPGVTPPISSTPYPERANALRYPAPGTTPAAAPAGSGTPMPGNPGVFKHGSNTFSDSATKPVWSNTGKPSAAVSTLMDGVAQRSGQAPAGWQGQNLGMLRSGPVGVLPMNNFDAPSTYPDVNAARAAGRDTVGLREGGDLRTGQGGDVPGSGHGDKIPAKYEPGEFVVSNDMLDAQPELRQHLRDLRGEVLAAKGMTPEQADAKALTPKGLRAEDAFERIPGESRQAPAYDGSQDGVLNTELGRNVSNTVNALGGLGRVAGGAIATTGRISSAIKGAGNLVDAAAPALAVAQNRAAPIAVAPGVAPGAAPAAPTIAGDATMPGQDPNRPSLREAPAVDWAARKAERDNQTQRDTAFGDRMESRRLAQEAAGYAAQAQPQHLGSQWEREKDAWNASVKSTVGGNDGLSARQRRQFGVQDAQVAATREGNRLQADTSLRTTSMNNDTSLRTTGMNNDTSLRTNENTNRTTLRGQDMDLEGKMAPTRYAAQQRQLAGQLLQQTGGDLGAATKLAMRAGVDPTHLQSAWTADTTNRTAEQNMGDKAREGLAKEFMVYDTNKNGEQVANPQASTESLDALRSIIPGMTSADPKTREAALSDAKAMHGIFIKARSQDPVGWDAMKFWQPERPKLSGMPDAAGSSTQQLSGLDGMMTLNAENGDTVMRQKDGRQINLGRLDARQRQLIDDAQQRGWGK